MGVSYGGSKDSITRLLNKPGIQMHYDASNSTSYPGSGTTWFDISGNGANLTMDAGCTYSSTTALGSMSFNGSGTASIASTSGAAFGSGDYTIECWFRNTTSASAYGTIWALNTWHGFRFGDNGFGNKLQCGVNMSTVGGCWSTAITKTSSQNLWYYSVMTRSSGSNSLWLNGAIQSINSGINPSTYPFTSFSNSEGAASTTSFQLGGGSSQGLVGNISICRVYKRSLSSDEILQNFYLQRGRFGV